jgi:hypothetical protein
MVLQMLAHMRRVHCAVHTRGFELILKRCHAV